MGGHASKHSGWGDWRSDRTLRALLAFVAAAALAAAVGIVALWPSAGALDSARSNADDIGLVVDRLAATITEVRDAPCSYSAPDDPLPCRTITARLGEGPDAGASVALPEFSLGLEATAPQVSVGDKVILGYEDSNDYYFFADRDRRVPLAWLAGLFAVVVLALARLRGALALAGMAVTLAVLVGFIGPSVLDGNDPVLVAVVGCGVIAVAGLYLTHGFNPTTTVALAGTLSSLGLTLAVSSIFFRLADFTGLASEEGLTVRLIAAEVDLGAVLLAGAIIGALGALDDVTVTQAATIEEMRHHNPGLGFKELFASGLHVGREHIASTINTLLLAYAGAGFPLLLVLLVSDQSLIMAANSELIAVEIVRTLCGSMGLVAAVPITTALAAALRPGTRTLTEDSTAPVAAAEMEPSPRWEDFAPDDSR